MFNFAKNLILDTATRAWQPFPMYTDIEVVVGNHPNWRTIRIPLRTWRANSTLQRRVSHGSIITNADAHIFEMLIEFLEHDFRLKKPWQNRGNPFKKLINGDDMMLDLAKAWHLGEMLELRDMQNALIEAYSAQYEEMIRTNARIPLSREPFDYLMNHVAFRTKCEVFIINFLIGLARYGGDFEEAEVKKLPDYVVADMQRAKRGFELRPNWPDSIKKRSRRYRVDQEENTKCASALRVSKQVTCPVRRASLPIIPVRDHSLSRSSSWTDYFGGRRNPENANMRGQRARLSIPSISENEQVRSNVLRPALASPPPTLDRTQSTPPFTHMPFGYYRSPSGAARRSTRPTLAHRSLNDETSDEETIVKPASDPRPRQDSHQVEEQFYRREGFQGPQR